VTDSDQVKAALAALAAGDGDASVTDEPASARTGSGAVVSDEHAEYRQIIDRATAATDDIEAAAEFVDSTGLDQLREAVNRAEREVSGLATEGRAALDAFERYRLAAKGPPEQ